MVRATVGEAINAAQGDEIDQLDGRVDQAETDLAAVEGRVDLAETGLDALEDRVAGAEVTSSGWVGCGWSLELAHQAHMQAVCGDDVLRIEVSDPDWTVVDSAGIVGHELSDNGSFQYAAPTPGQVDLYDLVIREPGDATWFFTILIDNDTDDGVRYNISYRHEPAA
jgi:hypothetical protein